MVSSKDANQGLGISFVQEVLSIVEQLYKNSGEARRLSAGSLFELADSSRRSGSSMKTCNNGPWMLDVLKCLLMEKTDKRLGNMLVFQRALAALCECIVSDDARSYFLKVGWL